MNKHLIWILLFLGFANANALPIAEAKPDPQCVGGMCV